MVEMMRQLHCARVSQYIYGCWTSLSLVSISDWTLQINVFYLTMEGVLTPENVKHLNLMSTVGVVLMALVNVLLQPMIALVRYK